jgi:hypothetical protein
LSEISWGGGGSGWKPMLKQPLLRDITINDWIKLYDKSSVHGMPHPESLVVFWNRCSAKHEKFMMQGIYNCEIAKEPNNFFVTTSEFIPALIDPEIMDAIMRAFIEAFDGYRGYYNCRHQSYGNSFNYVYQLWLKDGIPYPEKGEFARMDEAHPPPAISEPWHGGTRYIWPQYEPRAFLGLEKLSR